MFHQNRLGRFRMLWAGVLSLGLGTWALAAPVDKIGGRILDHRQVKAELRGKAVADQRKALVARGIVSRSLDAEACALYVQSELTPAEIASYATQGITIEPTYIPPVPGQHPLGFYLATVRYDALDTVRNDARLQRLESAEARSRPKNDAGNALTHADLVHAGTGVTAATGAGVLVAIADSGLDVTHPDVPTPVEAYDVTDGATLAQWGTDVKNTVSDHGTHVTGTAVGRGTASTARGTGAFIGAAPGASLAFYKIGEDADASSSDAYEIRALNRAVTIGAKVFSLSYGGLGAYMDGSEAMEQAVDAAVATGVVVLAAAGNEADGGWHDSVTVAPASTSAAFGYTIDNSSGGSQFNTAVDLQVIWRDGVSGDANVTLAITNLGGSESLTAGTPGSSLRGTESRTYTLHPRVSAGASKTYQLTVTNGAASGISPLVHVYDLPGAGQFDSPDTAYTLSSPADADSALAVAAWVHRETWTNWEGSTYFYPGLSVGQLAVFSSRGPRIDGTIKPDVAGPGSATISLRDSDVPETEAAMLIDDDGSNDSTGPTSYCVKLGTSMATPHVAGVVALMRQANPAATPAEIRSALTQTASQGGAPDSQAGYGVVNALQAVITVPVELSSFVIE